MSSKRFKGDEEVNVYHCILKAPDRTPGNREFAFGEAEKCKMAQLVQELQQDYLLEVLAWSHMSTHSHQIIVHRPDALKQLGRDNLRLRYQNHLRKKGVSEKSVEHVDLRCRDARRYAERINDLSSFCGVLAQRFAQWYNRKYSHRGNVWTPRFKSLLLTSLKAVVRCTQYVELNPVRAHMVHWAKDYRHNSFHLIQRGGDKAEALKVKLIEVLRHFGGFTRKKWSNKRFLRLYTEELEQISDLPQLQSSIDESTKNVLMSGHSWWSGSGGVVCIGGDDQHLQLRTISSTVKELQWNSL